MTRRTKSALWTLVGTGALVTAALVAFDPPGGEHITPPGVEFADLSADDAVAGRLYQYICTIPGDVPYKLAGATGTGRLKAYDKKARASACLAAVLSRQPSWTAATNFDGTVTAYDSRGRERVTFMPKLKRVIRR